MATRGNGAPVRKDLTPQMRRALRGFYVGRPWAHLSGRSQYGGSNETSLALHRRGLIDRLTDTLTEDGLLECHALFGDETVYAREAASILGVFQDDVPGLVEPVADGPGPAGYRLRDVVNVARDLPAPAPAP